MSLKEALDQYTAIKKEREYIADKVMALERQIEHMADTASKTQSGAERATCTITR